MSAFYSTYQTLINEVETLDSITPKSFDGMELTPDEIPNDLWMRVKVIPTVTEPITLGLEGEDQSNTILQVDFLQPVGKGTQSIYQKADEFASHFTAGKGIIYNSYEVKIISSSLSNPYTYEGFTVLTLSIQTYNRYNRS